MNPEFLTAEDVLKRHPNITRMQLAEMVCAGLLPFHFRATSAIAIRVHGLEKLQKDIEKYRRANRNERAFLVSKIESNFYYLLFTSDKVNGAIKRGPLQRDTKPSWNPDTHRLTVNGKSHDLKNAPAQWNILTLLFKANGKSVNKEELRRPDSGSLQDWRPDHRIKRINKVVKGRHRSLSDLIVSDGEKGYYIPSLRKRTSKKALTKFNETP